MTENHRVSNENSHLIETGIRPKESLATIRNPILILLCIVWGLGLNGIR